MPGSRTMASRGTPAATADSSCWARNAVTSATTSAYRGSAAIVAGSPPMGMITAPAPAPPPPPPAPPPPLPRGDGLRARTRRLPAHVEQVRPFLRDLQAAPDRLPLVVEPADVREGVRGHVQDSHHKGPADLPLDAPRAPHERLRTHRPRHPPPAIRGWRWSVFISAAGPG